MKILRMKEVVQKVGLKQSSIYNKVNAKAFPGPISLGPKSVGWVESEIEDWLLEKIKERDELVEAN